jgi:hypothetical protein
VDTAAVYPEYRTDGQRPSDQKGKTAKGEEGSKLGRASSASRQHRGGVIFRSP